MIVGVCRLSLLVPHSHSLKEKRAVVRRIKDRARQKYGVALSEVGGLDTWQRAVLGLAVVGADRDYVEQTLGKVAALIESMGVAEVVANEREVLVYGEEPLGQTASGASDDSWIPDEWREEADG